MSAPNPFHTKHVKNCDDGLPQVSVFAGYDADPDEMPLSPITDIQVCFSDDNPRVKGIRARVRGVRFPEGTRAGGYDTVAIQERFGCARWQPLVSCPGNMFAIGATLYFKDGSVLSPRDYLTGISLACSEVDWVEVE